MEFITQSLHYGLEKFSLIGDYDFMALASDTMLALFYIRKNSFCIRPRIFWWSFYDFIVSPSCSRSVKVEMVIFHYWSSSRKTYGSALWLKRLRLPLRKCSLSGLTIINGARKLPFHYVLPCFWIFNFYTLPQVWVFHEIGLRFCWQN